MKRPQPSNLSFLLRGTLLFLFACTPAKEGAETAGGEVADTTVAVAASDSTVVEEEVPVTADWANAEAIIMDCGGATDLAGPVQVIAANITDDSLDYNQEPFSDCSGIFHRVLDSLKKRCDDYAYPAKETYRSSRGLGQWYYEQGNFIRVTDPLNMDHLIKPGAVMFYGSPEDGVSTEALFDQGGINHVGVIVSVEKDEEGVVTGYSLFHGQTYGKLASTTDYHKRTYANRTDYPPYGNGRDKWLGVAPIISPDTGDDVASTGGE